MRAIFIVCMFAASSVADAPKDPYAAWRDPIAKLVGAAHDGAVFKQLDELSDTVGGRVSGTPRYAKAVTWATAQLVAAGAQNVHTEAFTLAHGWQRGTARASIVTPVARTIRVESFGWSPSTPGAVRGQVAIVRGVEPPVAPVAGKIVVLDTTGMQWSPKAWLDVLKLLPTLKAKGAVAVLWANSRPNNVLSTGTSGSRGELTALPAADIGLEDYKAIARVVERGPVTVEVAIANTVTGPIQVASVIGELKGRDKADEWLLVGAHLDSWDFATGTQDNGSGVVQVIQTARLLAAAGPLRRSVRFALWGGEEQGDVGSLAYVVAHASELDRCVATLNTDNGAGHVKGWKVQKRKDVQTALTPLTDRVLANLGGGVVDLAITTDTDHFAFLQAGVPALDLLVEDGNYNTVHHTVADTLDKVDPHALASGLAVIAVTAYVIASSPDRFAPRLDRKALEPLFKPDGIDELLRFEKIWP